MYAKFLSTVVVLMVGVPLMATSAAAQSGSSTTGQASPAVGGPTASAQGASVYFINIKDGAKVGRTFTVQFGLRNMGLAPAGSDRENAGHHHLLIDTDLPPMNEPIPSDFNHLHYGAGQSEATVTLPAGEHTLQLLFADKNHIPHTPPVLSERIKVTVVEGSAPSASAPEKPKAKRSSQGAERQRMRPPPGIGAVAIPRPAAEHWCQIQGLNTTCGFTSFAQCLASASGVGGHCIQR